jgi:ubiquinone/menaquinone biosynthesis C-methylase UbiE
MPTESPSPVHNHKAVVREEFTRQANAYASAPVITNEDRLARLVTAIAPTGIERALEVATGPGYVAMALAARCREVVGVDLTAAPLEIAERTRNQRGLKNVSFRMADADNLPFADGQFDIAVCRFAFHHFQQPGRVLAEMCRVCRPRATIAIEDLYSSEIPERAAYYNRFERLRDQSHTRALAPTELIRTLAERGIELQRLYSDELTVEVQAWLENAKTRPEDMAEVWRMLEADMREDLSGTRPAMLNGRMMFEQRTVALIGRKLAR